MSGTTFTEIVLRGIRAAFMFGVLTGLAAAAFIAGMVWMAWQATR